VTVTGDLRAFFDYRRQGELRFWKWLTSYRGTKVWAELSFDDRAVIYDVVRRATLRFRNSRARERGLERPPSD